MNIKRYVSIDWLAYTVDEQPWMSEAIQSPSGRQRVARNVSGELDEFIEANPREGYAFRLTAMKNPMLSVSMGSPLGRQGVHVVFTGSALSKVEPEARLKHALYASGRLTRLDVALDVDAPLDFRALYDAAQSGRLNTKAKRSTFWTEGEGATVYIGARTSTRFLRVYNKAAEAGLSFDRTRLEVEFHGRAAQQAGQYLAGRGLTDIPAIIRAFCDWPGQPEWEAIFDGIVAVGLPKLEKVTDRERWIREQLRPALMKAMREDSYEVKHLVALLLDQCSWEQHDEMMKIQMAIHDEIPF
jgi:hypothetical protein